MKPNILEHLAHLITQIESSCWYHTGKYSDFAHSQCRRIFVDNQQTFLCFYYFQIIADINIQDYGVLPTGSNNNCVLENSEKKWFSHFSVEDVDWPVNAQLTPSEFIWDTDACFIKFVHLRLLTKICDG